MVSVGVDEEIVYAKSTALEVNFTGAFTLSLHSFGGCFHPESGMEMQQSYNCSFFMQDVAREELVSQTHIWKHYR